MFIDFVTPGASPHLTSKPRRWLPLTSSKSSAAPAPADPPPTPTPTPPLPAGLQLWSQGFVSPLVLAPLGPGRFLVADQPGLIYVTDADGKASDRPFLDLRPRITPLKDGFDERGLLGLALHPCYGQNRKFYVVYSAPLRPNAPRDWDSTLHLSEFTTDSKDPTRADPASEKTPTPTA